jgi:two-component system sensor histidine kinase BarA
VREETGVMSDRDQENNAAPPTDGPRRVLLADDERVSRFAARRFLEKAGYAVDEVADGRAAVAAATSEARPAYALILLDYEMPLLDGVEAARQIREAERARGGGGGGAARVPIVALTAHHAADVAERCTEAGMDGCLTKPLEKQTFHALMSRLRCTGGAPAATRAISPAVAVNETADAAQSPPIDVPALMARALDDAAFVRGFLEQFRAQAAEQFERMAAHARAGFAHGVAEEAHRLRGAAAHVSAARLMELSRSVETAAKSGNTPGAAAVDELGAEVRRCIEYALRAMENIQRMSAA